MRKFPHCCMYMYMGADGKHAILNPRLLNKEKDESETIRIKQTIKQQ